MPAPKGVRARVRQLRQKLSLPSGQPEGWSCASSRVTSAPLAHLRGAHAGRQAEAQAVGAAVGHIGQLRRLAAGQQQLVRAQRARQHVVQPEGDALGRRQAARQRMRRRAAVATCPPQHRQALSARCALLCTPPCCTGCRMRVRNAALLLHAPVRSSSPCFSCPTLLLPPHCLFLCPLASASL